MRCAYAAVAFVATLVASPVEALSSPSAKAVRRDYATLSQFEKDEFARGINILKERGDYDDLVLVHLLSFETATPWEEKGEVPDITKRNGESRGPSFYPWHREFLIAFEQKMQEVLEDDTFGIPYWNFVKDGCAGCDPKANPMWTSSEMGSDGRASDGLVVDGPFANWDIKYTRNPETKLTRFLGVREVRPARTGDLENAYGQTKFDQAPYDSVAEVGFRPWGAGWWSVRGSREVGGATLHSSHHGFIGGSNGRGSSPNDPTFWLAHSFNDGYWYEWQNVQLARFPNSTHLDWYEPVVGGPTGHNLNDVIVGLDRTIAMTLDHADLAYTYDENIPSATICPFGNLNACISYCSAENYETCAQQCSSFC